MIIKAFGTAFGVTFIAELGDKTQIAILTLSARYGYLPVFLGAGAAFVIMNALAVTVGEVLARYVPKDVIQYVSAGIFIIFGLLSFLPERGKDETERVKKPHGPFLTSLAVIAFMELGDKTQLALIAMTSRFKEPIFIFLGGTLALLLTSFIGAIAGKWLSRVVPSKYIRWSSGVVFIAFGILIATGVL
jgi:putative Ca2+/H+ antiporter (TMEM165/GDT1 family)